MMDVLQRLFASNYVRKTHVSDYELIYEHDLELNVRHKGTRNDSSSLRSLSHRLEISLVANIFIE